MNAEPSSAGETAPESLVLEKDNTENNTDMILNEKKRVVYTFQRT